MAQGYVKGPVGVWVGTGPGSTPVFLGTGERAPRISLRREYEPLRNDIAGTRLAFDYAYQGQEGFVTVKLTRWNQSVLQTIENAPDLAATPGFDLSNDIGRLMVLEGAAVPLWVEFSYGTGAHSANPVMVAGGLPGCYHFFAAFLDNEESLEGGTDPASAQLTFHCVRVYNPTTGNMSLYNFDTTGLGEWN